MEAEKLIPVTEEIKELAGPVIEYLSAFTEASARGLEERLDKLHSTAET